MAWTPWGQSPQPPAKRRSGTPQLVIGIVMVGLTVVGRAGNESSPLPSDPIELGTYVFLNLAMIAGGVVLIVIGARIKSRNNKADLAARQQGQLGLQAQQGPYGQQPGPYRQPGQYGQPGAYGQQPQQPGSSAPYDQPWQQGSYGPSQPPGNGNPPS